MAIDPIVHSPNQSFWAIGEESTFGTPLGDGGTFIKMEGPIPSVDYALLQDLGPKQTGSRVALKDTKYVTQKGGLRVISFSDLVVRQKDLGLLLYGVTQNVTEGATTPYDKAFVLDETTTQPDFSGNGGIFFTVIIADAEEGDQRKFTSCILRTLTLTADVTSGDGRLMASGEFVTGFESDDTANFNAATVAYQTQSYINFNNLTTATIATNDIVLYSFSITINNNAARVGNTTAGACQTYSIGVPEYEVTGNIVTKYDDNTKNLLADFLAGTERAIVLATGTSGGSGDYVNFTHNLAIFTGNENDYGSNAAVVNLPFKCVGDSTGSDNMIDYEVEDAVDRSW